MTTRLGKVYLVGAGPGDPGLLTLRGAECLANADVVLYDYLASPRLLEHAPAAAERICLGRHGRGRLLAQSEINALMVDYATQGRTVVRLKGGDPMLFGRAVEEIEALTNAGVPYEIVPGVSSALAASSYAGIPLTDRDVASCVAFVTGQESGDKPAERALDYGALAAFPGTLVFFMAVTTAAEWTAALIERGKPAVTPVAIVRRTSFADQQTILTTLGEVASVIAARRLRPPALVIVGDVARHAELATWFTSRPLFGRTVLVTRPAHQAAELAEPLGALGANVLMQPAIEIREPDNWVRVDAVIQRLDEFGWVAFSSANGVHYFMGRLEALGFDARCLGRTKLAAIGPATVEALRDYSLKADLQPPEYRAESLADSLGKCVQGKRVFLARASRGREVLAEMLTAAGAIVEQAVVYNSVDVTKADPEIAEELAAGRIDWTTVTSSAIARSLVNLFGDALRQTKLAAISPLTGETLCELGYPPTTVAETFTTQGIEDAILAAEEQSPR